MRTGPGSMPFFVAIFAEIISEETVVDLKLLHLLVFKVLKKRGKKVRRISNLFIHLLTSAFSPFNIYSIKAIPFSNYSSVSAYTSTCSLSSESYSSLLVLLEPFPLMLILQPDSDSNFFWVEPRGPIILPI